jgi:predicted DNA-binding ribbon-helix-helix protein
MDLPKELENQFQIKLKAFEEARQMKYVTTIERMAEERGRVAAIPNSENGPLRCCPT